MISKRNRRSPIGISLIVALLLASGALAYRNTQHLNREVLWVAHSRQVLDSVSNVMLNVVDAETGQRGYLITGNEDFLEPYHAALVRLRTQIQTLKDETQDNPGQQERIQRFDTAIARRLVFLKQGIELRKVGEKDAQDFVIRQEGKAEMEAVRAQFHELQQEEQELLAIRQQHAESAYRIALSTSVATTVAGLTLVAGVVWLRRSHRRQQNLSDLSVEKHRNWLRMALTPTPEQREAILGRIEAIEGEMSALQTRTVREGIDLRSAWDRLYAERSFLEQKFWEQENRV